MRRVGSIPQGADISYSYIRIPEMRICENATSSLRLVSRINGMPRNMRLMQHLLIESR
jgi:hypothetical protein